MKLNKIDQCEVYLMYVFMCLTRWMMEYCLLYLPLVAVVSL